MIIACNECIKYGYNKEKNHADEVNFPWQKMIYNFAITVTRIHFAVCEVWSNNLNPEILWICKAATKIQDFVKSAKILIGRVIKQEVLINHKKKALLKLFNSCEEIFIHTLNRL